MEFVPKEDSQTQRLLAVRRDVFDRYDRGQLETALGAHFALEPRPVPGSGRILFLCRERQ